MTAPKKTITGRHILYIFLAFFGTIFVANFFLINYATKSWNGLVDKNAYENGLAYNQTLKARATENALAWRITPLFPTPPTHNTPALFQVTVADKTGKNITNATIQATFSRPVHEGNDFTLPLTEKPPTYTTTATFPLAGAWDITLTITHNTNTVKTTQRITVQ